MINDGNLRSSLDYSEGQKEAAHRILIELINLFGEYKDDIRVVGGWVPDLMFRSQHVQGVKALKATGGNFAFEFPAQDIRVEAKRPDGSMDVAHINVVAVVPYLIMKSAALGRGKAKDAYDIYFLIKHYYGGVKKLAEEFDGLNDLGIVNTMKQKLQEKFASEKYAGPKDVADFLDLLDEDEIDMVKRDAYEQVQALLHLIV